MSVLADDDVVMHRDAERFCGVDDDLGHVDIGARWCWVATRMVVERPTKLNMVLNFQRFFDVLAEQVPVIGIGFCDRM